MINLRYLLAIDIKTNSQANIINLFDEYFIDNNKIDLGSSFSDLIYQINKYAPKEEFAKKYIKDSEEFLQKVREFRQNETTLTESTI